MRNTFTFQDVFKIYLVFLHSSTLALKDVNGSNLDGLAPIAVQVSHGSPRPTLVVNVAATVVQAGKP